MMPVLWGGAECTINRVGDKYSNQTVRTGHTNRLSDFERFAALGVKALRHGVLWEWVDDQGWSWADSSLPLIRELGMEPVVGLLHHGSGPHHTDLLDPDFPTKFVAYARQVAERYPWVDAYTPINEPLTTARFSGLYGHWYPHRTDDRSFVRALLHQLKATVLAMDAIRAVQPNAKLVQTEDIGHIWSTSRLAYQSQFECLRRWLTYDLLCGRVDERHEMNSYLRWAGATEKDIFFFRDHPCSPDTIGVNYYLTSDRYLDHRTDLYPHACVGGNGRDRYVDVEAVRARAEGIGGSATLLMEAWERYRLPVAITEVHNGGCVDDQIRWFADAWQGAKWVSDLEIPVQGVTAWALVGSCDWDSLVVREDNHYEPGAFVGAEDGVLRATELAEVLAQAGNGNSLKHPALDEAGWWHGPERLLLAPECLDAEVLDESDDFSTRAA